jgi:putative DNA methylase
VERALNDRPYPQRLIEVDLPIKRISAHARREKSIRHGHISTLHIWWARRPLASCRAVICAALWPDPADPLCPQSFRDAANGAITAFARKVCGQGKIGTANLSATCSEESLHRWEVLAKPGQELDAKDEAHRNVLRFALLDFIADFANWDNSTVPEYLETARALTQAAHEALGGEPGTRPLVVDPFAGGGSIPLEALRVGADAFASDLNPVAVLLNKVVLEYIPKYGQTLADEVRRSGRWVREQAQKELAQFYPKDPDNANPIAYLWTRTVACEGPGCGAEIPLMRSLWLAKKAQRAVAVHLVPRPRAKRVDFEIVESAKAKDVGEGTVRRGSATCPCCGYTTPVASVRRQLKEKHGGAAQARLFCVVTTRAGEQGRTYRLPTDRDREVVAKSIKRLEQLQRSDSGSLSFVPNERINTSEIRRITVPIYGVETWGGLFSPRQSLTLGFLARLIASTGRKSRSVPKFASESGGDSVLEAAVKTCLAFILDRCADKMAAQVVWHTGREFVDHVFARQAIPVVWEFAEANFFSDIGWDGACEWVVKVIEANSGLGLEAGQAAQASATALPLPNGSVRAFITDPPYYYSVPYSHLSDFFYVWLRRTLADLHPQMLSEEETPKDEECVQNLPHSEFAHCQKSREFFEQKLGAALQEAARISAPEAIGTVVFAHTETAAWESLVSALVLAGWCVTASWPIDTEMTTRLLAKRQSTLSSSVHLVCRPRAGSQVGDWRDVLAELPKRIHQWMPRLASEGVVGADSIFACLGPALEVYSRYARVEKASGEQVPLKEYLEQVWAAVSKEALSMIFAGADASGFDPDARLTAMWFWTLSTGVPANHSNESDDDEDVTEENEGSGRPAKVSGFVLEYDTARKIAQGLGAHLEQLATVVEVKGDKARLLPVSERARHLFGKEESDTATKRTKAARQRTLFDESDQEAGDDGGWGELTAPQAGATVLDRLHQTMILFAAGRSEAMRRFMVEEGVGRDTRVWRLAQALSALYPTGTEEKRWVDGVLGRKKGLGF